MSNKQNKHEFLCNRNPISRLEKICKLFLLEKKKAF